MIYELYGITKLYITIYNYMMCKVYGCSCIQKRNMLLHIQNLKLILFTKHYSQIEKLSY